MTIKIHGTNVSPFVRKVRIVLEEANIPYELLPVNIFKPTEEFLAISPMKQIPVMETSELHGDNALPDSTVICAYLARKHKLDIYPEDDNDFAKALWLEEYADTKIVQTLGPGVFRGIVINQLMGKEPEIERARHIMQEKAPQVFDYLEKQLVGKDFLVANRFTLADIAVASPFVNLRYTGAKIDNSRWPALSDFIERILARDSFSKLIEEESPLFNKPVEI